MHSRAAFYSREPEQYSSSSATKPSQNPWLADSQWDSHDTYMINNTFKVCNTRLMNIQWAYSRGSYVRFDVNVKIHVNAMFNVETNGKLMRACSARG